MFFALKISPHLAVVSLNDLTRLIAHAREGDRLCKDLLDALKDCMADNEQLELLVNAKARIIRDLQSV